MPTATDRRPIPRQRPLAMAGIAAPVVLVLGVVVAGLTWPGYSHRTQNISDLGGTDAVQPALLNLTLVLFGLLVVAFAVALHRVRTEPADTPAGPLLVGPLLVGYFGATAALQGLTPCTPGCAAGTPADRVHALAALTGLVAVALAMLGSWRATRPTAGRSPHGTFSAWTGVGTLGFLVAWLVAAGVDPHRLQAGVLQRALFALVLCWLAVTAVRLLREPLGNRGDQPRPHRTSETT